MNNFKDEKLLKAFKHEMAHYDRDYTMRYYVHTTLFRETIWAQGSDEQYAAWKDKIERMEVIGCFAMTELGHSSFLRGLETYATYDASAQEFVIHSTTLTATKWWIGMAGQV